MTKKKTYDLDGRRWHEVTSFGHVTRDEERFTVHCRADWPGQDRVKILCEDSRHDAAPDLSVGAAVLILGDIRSWIVTQPRAELNGGFVASCAEFGIKLFLHSQVTAVYRYGSCIWKKKK